MKIINKESNVLKDKFYMESMFPEAFDDKNMDASLNYVEIAGKTTVPVEGYSIHEHDELSYIVEGELEVEIDGQIQAVKKGDFTFIPKGEAHQSTNISKDKCKIVSLLI